VIGSVIGALFLIGALALLVAWARERRHDSGVLRDLMRQGKEIQASALLAALSAIKTSRGAREALAVACGVDLTKSPALLCVLSDISAWTESESSGTAALGAEVTAWAETADRRSRRAVRAAGSATLDRIARAVEQAELARQGETAAHGEASRIAEAEDQGAEEHGAARPGG